jgi:esterase/lipase superfamily enzyme
MIDRDALLQILRDSLPARVTIGIDSPMTEGGIIDDLSVSVFVEDVFRKLVHIGFDISHCGIHIQTNMTLREVLEVVWSAMIQLRNSSELRGAGDATVLLGEASSSQSTDDELPDSTQAVLGWMAHGRDKIPVALTQSPPFSDSVHVYQVWYGTNRKPCDKHDAGKGFLNEPDSGATHYGRCLVAIPRTHVFGSVGTPWWKRWARLEFTNDRLRVVHIDKAPNATDFFSDLRQSLTGSDRQVLLYLHGYNVSFNDAAVRAAQIGFDLKIKGVTTLFSWPSCGRVIDYLADSDRIAASEAAIAAFLARMANTVANADLHVIAHSMGNRGLARAIERILAKASRNLGFRLGHIVLAAPDIEVALFSDLASVYPTISRRTTMYVSARDKALELSKWIQQSHRAGYTPPVTVVSGIDTVEVTAMDLTLLGHGYYAEADGVLRDIYDLINFDASPEQRPRTKVSGTTPSYWIIS